MKEPKADRKFSFFSAKEVFYLINFNKLIKKKLTNETKTYENNRGALLNFLILLKQ